MSVGGVDFNPNNIRRINISTKSGKPESVRIQTNRGITSAIVTARRGYEFLEEVVSFLAENAVEYMCYVTEQNNGVAQVDFVRRDDLLTTEDGLGLLIGADDDDNVPEAPEMPFNILFAIDVYEEIVDGKVIPTRHDLFWKEEQIEFATFHPILDANHNYSGNIAFYTLDGGTHVVGHDEQITILLKSGGQGI